MLKSFRTTDMIFRNHVATTEQRIQSETQSYLIEHSKEEQQIFCSFKIRYSYSTICNDDRKIQHNDHTSYNALMKA